MKQISVILLLSTLFFNAFTQPYYFKGRIINSTSGEGLTGAHISIYHQENNNLLAQGLTGKDGIFAFSGLATERVNIILSYIGFRLVEKTMILSSDESFEVTFEMVPSPIPVGEITVTALRRDKLLRNISMPVAVLTDKNIEKLSAFSMSDVIQNEPGLSLVRDGIWSTSLNIRGLTENRIVTLIDGNRIETSTDIAAGLAMFDIHDIERIEVIKGAASSLYGTGAMGGVINIITKEGRYHENLYATGNVTGSYHTVNNMNTTNASVIMGDRNWNFRVSGTFRDAGNTSTPGGELPNSQFTDNNVSVRLGIKPAEHHEIKFNYQRFFAKNVGIPGGKAFPPTATATFPRELRDMFSVSYEIENPGKILDEVKLKYFHQYILREVELKPNANATTLPAGYHSTDGLQLQTGWNPWNNHYITAGIDIWQRHLRTERKKIVYQPVLDGEGNLITTNQIIIGEIPIPESWHRSAGIFLQDETRMLNDKIKLTAGGRLDLLNVKNEKVLDPLYRIMNGVRTDSPSNQRLTFEAGNVSGISWSADLGILYHLTRETDLSLSVSKAYRSPSLDERFKYIDLGATVRMGNPDLKPENGYFVDLGTKIWKERFQFSANTFVNFMNNLIVEMPGVASFPLLLYPDSSVTVPALINSNVDKALLYGFDLSTHYNIRNGMVLYTSASFVRGRDTKNNNNLPGIPPFNSRSGIRYNPLKWFGTEFTVNLAADQEKIAEGESATKGYARYDIVAYSNPLKVNFLHLSFTAGVENLTDRPYINHLASNRGFIKYEPGRNIFFRVRAEF